MGNYIKFDHALVDSRCARREKVHQTETKCHKCKKTTYAYNVPMRINGKSVRTNICIDCFDAHYIMCDSCDHVSESHLHQHDTLTDKFDVHEYKTICWYCYNFAFVHCFMCAKKIPRADGKIVRQVNINGDSVYLHKCETCMCYER